MRAETLVTDHEEAIAVWIAFASAAVTAVVLLLIANLTPPERRIGRRLDRLYSTDSPQFRHALDSLLGPPLVEGNHVAVLLNGDRIFAAMLEAAHNARRTITFETHIYWSGTIGEKFADALAERAHAGVQVHLLLDWIGSVRMSEDLLQRMTEAGVEVERYHRPGWSKLQHLNNRTHRKLMVVDGTVGFTGGVGIADQWLGNAEDPSHWRDTHFCVRGPVVAQIQAVFIDNWMKATGHVLHGEDYFPQLAVAGTKPAQMFKSSASGGGESMHLMYLLTIAAARRSILLSSAYFVPDELAVHALIAAAERGVTVRIITPGPHIDVQVTRRASRALWGRLLAAGIQIAEYQPTMYHVKVLVVDGVLVSVGSTNFDNRSFRLNDEANLNVLDQEFAREQAAIFERDWESAKSLSLAEWKQRPWREKLLERAAVLLRQQL